MDDTVDDTANGTVNDRVNGRTGAAIVLCVALLGSALAVLAVRRDLLTGRTPAVTTVARPCAAPEIAPDLSPTIPGNALTTLHGFLPMLPVPGLGAVAPLRFSSYETPAQYQQFSSPLLGGGTRSAMEGNGFVRANTIGYESGPTFFGAEAFQTSSPAQAAELARRLLANACEAGVASALRPVAGVQGGVAFVYHDSDSPPYRATFLVGDTLVRLNVCICDDNRGDPYAVLDGWARAVDARMRAPLG